MKNILGIDVGASGIKGAIVDLNTGQLLEERCKIATPKPATPAAVAEVIAEVVKRTGYKGKLIGCGFPAIVKHGLVLSAANIDESWIGIEVEKLLSETTNRRVIAMNDADAAGLAEMQYGNGIGKMGTVLLITIGSGLGSALFTDGHLVRNSELGHIKMHNKAAERYVSNFARKRRKMTWEEFGKRFNEYLQLIDRLFSPDLVILGGGVSNDYALFSEHLDVKMNITTAMMLNNAGIIGAALYAYQNAK